jgi:hypothetical protein
MPHQYTTCLVAFAVTFLTFSCKQKDTTFEKLKDAGRIRNGIISNFTSTFPDKFEAFENPPELGSVGELTERSNLKFILLNFPESKISELEPWIRPLMKSYDLESVRISYFVHGDGIYKEYLTGTGFVQYSSDGSAEYKSGQKIEDAMPNPTIDGRPIPMIKQDGADQAPTRSESK